MSSENRFGRGKFMLGSAALVTLSMVSLECGGNESYFGEEPEKHLKELNKGLKTFVIYKDNLTRETMDPNYLNTLFNKPSENINPEKRAEAVANNLYIVMHKTSPVGVALQLDESGYYLTAGHPLNRIGSGNRELTNETLHMCNPRRDDSTFLIADRVHSVMPDFEQDTAIVFAPTGKPRKPVEGVHTATHALTSGKRLWQLALFVENADTQMAGIQLKSTVVKLSGVIDTPPEAPDRPPYKNLIRVKGMKPFAGASGAPVLNETGKVVGVESGYYPIEQVNERSRYLGAVITPIQYALDLRKPVYTYYQNGQYTYDARRIA